MGKGDTVAVMAANTPEMYHCHFGVPMTGAVLNTLNTRLDSNVIALHAEAWRSQGAYNRHGLFENHWRGCFLAF